MIRRFLATAAFALLPLLAAAPAMAGQTPTVPPCQSGPNLTAHPTCGPTTSPCPEVEGAPTTHPTCAPSTEPCHGPLDVSTVKACCPDRPDVAAYHECPPPCPVDAKDSATTHPTCPPTCPTDVKSENWPHPSPSCPSTTPSTTPSSSPSTSTSAPVTTPSSPSGTTPTTGPKPSGSSPTVVVTPSGPTLAHTGASVVPLTVASAVLAAAGVAVLFARRRVARRH